MININPVRRMRDFDDIADELDFLFNNYFKTRRPVLMPVEKGWRPLTDVYETDREIVIIMDIAGITPQDVNVQLDNNILILRGIRREQGGGHKRHYHKMEIDFGLFERRIELPAPVDYQRVSTRYAQGFLEIRLPKQEKKGPGRVVIPIE